MKYNVIIEPRAIADIQNAIDYYDEQQIGLGEKFIKAVDKHINYLFTNPYFQTSFKDYRVLPISKYPFILLFYIDETERSVYIASVFNTYQDTNKYPE